MFSKIVRFIDSLQFPSFFGCDFSLKLRSPLLLHLSPGLRSFLQLDFRLDFALDLHFHSGVEEVTEVKEAAAEGVEALNNYILCWTAAWVTLRNRDTVNCGASRTEFCARWFW